MASQRSELPVLRWGIIGTGWISNEFVQDILLSRPDAKASHIISAIGSSSIQKGNAFASKAIRKAHPQPTVHGSYHEVYQHPSVDIVYIGTPHAFHKQNCLDAITAGKHVLCEKAFALNVREAKEILAAAQQRGVFVMEAMWLRFQPLMSALHDKLHEDHAIGEVRRLFCDFGLDMDLPSLGRQSRLKNPALGAGSLLDIGVYCITWALVLLEDQPDPTCMPTLAATQTLVEGVDVASSILLHFPSTGRQAILTSTVEAQSEERFCVIEGSRGSVHVYGEAASVPASFRVFPKNTVVDGKIVKEETAVLPARGELYAFEQVGQGFYHEADAVALDIAAGRTQNQVMSHAETLRVVELMDRVRAQGGARFPQDDD